MTTATKTPAKNWTLGHARKPNGRRIDRVTVFAETSGGASLHVATVHGLGMEDPSDYYVKAHARMIVAAPAMLDALRVAVARMPKFAPNGEHCDDRQACVRAIALAEGGE